MADCLTKIQVIIHPDPVTTSNHFREVGLSGELFEVLPCGFVRQADSCMI